MSQSRLASCIPIPIEQKILVSVIEKAKDWALMHGVGMRDKKNFTKDAIQIAPFVLLPSPFPRSEFEKAVELQPVLNELMHKVAHDDEFLEQTLKNALQVDEFTRGLYNIWMKVREEGIMQSLSLGLFRSDYLMHVGDGNKIKQVEFNTVAASFGALTSNLPAMYRYILRQLGHGDLIKNMPENLALSGLCAGITEAYDLFGVPGSVVLFVVEEVSYNICDQRFHEFHIAETRPDIMIYRKTLGEIYEETELNEKKQLILEGSPVAVVYYRSGYEPAQYPTTKEWEARLRVERSTAIKCPSIQYQLAGTKKVQQALAAPGALERLAGGAAPRVRDIFTGLYSLDFDDSGESAVEMALADADNWRLAAPGALERLAGGAVPRVRDIFTGLYSLDFDDSGESAVEMALADADKYYTSWRLAAPGALERLAGGAAPRVRDIFTGLYSLDFDDSGESAVEMALADADKFVLKPQREGGGNNLYGPAVREALLRMRRSRERAAYILMERILPPIVSGYVVRAGAPVPPPITDLVSELGIFGVIIGTKDKIYSNKQVGHMLRTKLADADEGGVAAGLGALDSPYLLDI